MKKDIELTNRVQAVPDKDPDMAIVSMVEWQGAIYVASQKCIYKIINDKLQRLERK